MSELKPSPKCLLVFIDETGHEEFADPKYPLFGYGGCACLASYEETIRTRWKGLKQRRFGGREVGLHEPGLEVADFVLHVAGSQNSCSYERKSELEKGL